MICIDLESKGTDIAFLADIFTKLNEVNMKLEGSKMCLI